MLIALPDITYEGSVKNVRMIRHPTPARVGLGLFDYTDFFSVFDWGRMPDELRNKGKALATLTAFIFEAMQKPDTWQALKNKTESWEMIKLRRSM